MKIINKDTGTDFNIELNKLQGIERIQCPECSHLRKNKREKCFAWNHTEQIGFCHNCQNTYLVYKKLTFKDKYTVPEWNNNTDLSDNAVKYFEARKITQFTLRQLKITTGIEYMPQYEKEVDVIKFNYFMDNKLVNIKYRAKDKAFKMFSGAEMIFYNIDSIKDNDSCFVVEGEIDCLTLFECGFHNVVSVPNGANTGSNNIQYLDNCWEYFENKKQINLATDNDSPGITLRNELIRRFGINKCFLIDFEDQKDANDYLIKYGKEKLIEKLKTPIEIPIDGIVYLKDCWKNMVHTFKFGKKRGTSTYISKLDNCWTWRGGEVTLWTGYQNEGKTSFFNQIAILKAKMNNWKFAIFSPENYPPDEYYDELIHCYVGKSTDLAYKNIMSDEEYEDAAGFIHDHFFVVIPDDDFQLSTILDKFTYLIGKYGINACLIDPYNQIEHLMEKGEREDLYISRFMSKLRRFAVNHDISMNLIAHQITPIFKGKENYPQPDAYKIKGGGTFADKADNVISVWRPFRRSDFENTTVSIIVNKIKKQKLVGIPGEFDLFYDRTKNQYKEEFDEF